jgi:hypothetical protein
MWALPGLRRPNNTGLVSQADSAITQFRTRLQSLEREKTEKTNRQVDLWSILTPSPESEEEYKQVTADIGYLIRQTLCLEEHLRALTVARYHCRQGQCSVLSQLLALGDPCQNIPRPTTVMKTPPGEMPQYTN